MKPGFKTSECWMAILSSVVGILTASGIVSSDEADHLTKAVQALAGAAITIASTLGYIVTRVNLKQGVVVAASDASCSANPTQLSAAMIATDAANPKALLTGTAADAFHAALTKAGV